MSMKLCSALFISVILLFASSTSIAQELFNNSGDDPTILDFSLVFPLPSLQIKTENQSTLISYHMGNLTHFQTRGGIRLPVKPMKILLPYGSTLDKISVTSSRTVRLPRVDSMQSPLSALNTVLGSHMSAHTNDSYSYHTVAGIHTMRGYRILYLTIYPMYFDKSPSCFSYHPEMTMRISTKTDQFHPPVRPTITDQKKIGDIVDNPDILSSYPIQHTQHLSDPIPYLIITSERLVQSPLEDSFEYLLYEKQQQGLSGMIVTVEDILSNPEYSVNGTWGDNNPANPFQRAGQSIKGNYSRFDDTQARIRNFIRYAYNDLGTDYVLLGGDGDVDNETQNIIPARGLFANESGLPLISSNVTGILTEEEDDIPSDIYYACLDGTFNNDLDEHFGECADRNTRNWLDEADLLSEVSVGRACVDTYTEVAYFVSKTIQYQHNQDDPYLKKVLFVGEYLGFPGISLYGGNYKDRVLPYIPEGYLVNTLYDRETGEGWHKEDIMNHINHAPPHLINHDGHSNYGYNLKMRNHDIDSLENTKGFFLYSHGCNAGGFDNPYGYDCIAERLTAETPHGAFAAIMNARYGLGSENSLDSPSLALDISFFKALYNESIREIGPANHYSKEDHIWHIDENGIRWVVYETNLFGDPALAIHDPADFEIDLDVIIHCPQGAGALYLLGTRLCSLPFVPMPIIIGPLDIQVVASSEPAGYVFGVEFLLDDVSYHFDDEAPYAWHLDLPLRGPHTLTVRVFSAFGENYEQSVLFYGWIRGQ